MIDLQDQVKLLENFPPPNKWIVTATHMTVSLNPLNSTSQVHLGERLSVTVVAVGKDEHAFALKVKVN